MAKHEKKSLARRRPAEVTSGAAGAVVGAIVALLGLDLDPEQIGALVTLVGFVSATVSWWVERRRG